MYKRDYSFTTNVMDQIFQIRKCIEILKNDIDINTTDNGWKINREAYTRTSDTCCIFRPIVVCYKCLIELCCFASVMHHVVRMFSVY